MTKPDKSKWLPQIRKAMKAKNFETVAQLSQAVEALYDSGEFGFAGEKTKNFYQYIDRIFKGIISPYKEVKIYGGESEFHAKGITELIAFALNSDPLTLFPRNEEKLSGHFIETAVPDIKDAVLDAELDGAFSRTLLSQLTPREERILRMHYFNEMTLETIADNLGVGKERIGQIRSKALRKLKHPGRNRILQPFVEAHSVQYSDVRGDRAGSIAYAKIKHHRKIDDLLHPYNTDLKLDSFA